MTKLRGEENGDTYEKGCQVGAPLLLAAAPGEPQRTRIRHLSVLSGTQLNGTPVAQSFTGQRRSGATLAVPV
jgi:hypothetical protein